jgi:hypothetical protein
MPMKSIRIPPGGAVTLELTVDDDGNVIETRTLGEPVHTARVQDPAGGPPMVVSSKLKPDPMAIYLLATTIIEATRALDEHTQATERNRQAAAAAAEAHQSLLKRQRRWQQIMTPIILLLAVLSLVALLIPLVGWIGQHVHVS